jgi:hypothetical protein
LFATLTKTAGVCTNNSHSETHVSPVFNPIPYPPRPIPFCFTLLRTLLHFLAPIKNSTPLFCYDSALFRQNTRGWGYPLNSSKVKRKPDFPNLAESPVKRSSSTDLRLRTTSHEPRVTPSSVAALRAGCYDLVFHDPC